MGIINSGHIKKVLIYSILLSIIFGYNDKSASFVFESWLTNFIIIFIFCFISSFIHELGHILVAYLHGCSITLKFIETKRFGISTKAYFQKGIKIGPIFALLVTIFSNGTLYFPSISDYEVSEIKHKRLGKKFSRLSEWELAKIAASGPLLSILFAVLLKLFPLPQMSISPVTINIVIAIINILPIPLFDGYKTFIYSRTLFIFSFIFIVILAILLQSVNPILSLVIAVIFSLILLFFILFIPSLKKK